MEDAAVARVALGTRLDSRDDEGAAATTRRTEEGNMLTRR